jgi:replicative DNA helicase
MHLLAPDVLSTAPSPCLPNREKDQGADGEAKITLTIEKNRNGASGRRINLLFNGAWQRFSEAP